MTDRWSVISAVCFWKALRKLIKCLLEESFKLDVRIEAESDQMSVDQKLILRKPKIIFGLVLLKLQKVAGRSQLRVRGPCTRD